MDTRTKQCNRCGSSLSLVDYYRHRIECKTKGRSCVHCHKTFELLSSYHLHTATCLKRIVDRQRMRNQLRNFLPSKGFSNKEETEAEKALKSDVEAVPLKGPNYSTVCSLCQQSFRSVHLFRLHLAREGLCRPKPYICHTCNREFMSSYHLLSHEKRKKPCVSKSAAVASKGGLKVKFVRKKPKDLTIGVNMFNSESSNSVVSEGDEYSSKSKHFYEHKTGYEYKDPGYLGSMQQYANRNILKQRLSCKVCGLAFLSGEDLQKHFLVSPMCATRNDKVLEISTHSVSKQSEVKQTARKSFSSAGKTLVDLSKNEVSVISNQNQGHSLSRVAFGTKFVGQDGFTGSRKGLGQPPSSNYNEVGLSCNICRITFPDAETMQAHRKVHSAEKKNYSSKCPVCFQIFGNAFLLFSHQKKHQHWDKSAKSKPAGCKCPFCDKVFLYVRSRNAHLRGHADVDSISIENFLKKTTCEVCSLAFVSENQKIQHRKVEHPDWTDALPKLFSNFDLRNQDSGKRSHDQKKPLEQKQDAAPAKKLKVLVNVTPSLKAKLKAHPNTCPICFKQYSTTFVRNRHFRMHILDKAFECKWCPMKFHRSEPLNAHMQKEHNDRLGFECRVCGLRYLTKFRVLQHITKSHNAQAPQKLVRECDTPPLPGSIKKTIVSFKNGSISGKTENRSIDYEGKNEYKSKNNQEFYCEVCETSFLKLCGLQRHRQSKNHKDILATKDQQTVSNISKEESPSPVTVSVQSHSSPPHQQPQDDPGELIDDVRCSVCFRYYTSIIDFVPHRLGHFHHTGLSEITELNPYICELCSTPVDHHQKVQWHLLHHLQCAKAKKAKLPPWKFTFTPKNYQISPIRVTSVRQERPPPPPVVPHQVAKKSMSHNKADKQVQKEPTFGGIHKNIFTCDACNVVFTTKHHYSAHIRRYCPVRKAAMTAEDRAELEASPGSNWHLQESDFSKLICHYCSLEFGTDDELGWHEKSCRKVNGPVNGSLEDDIDEFLYCKACECLFPFEHSYIEHRKIFCFSEESLEKLLSDSDDDENLNQLKSAIEMEVGTAGCVRCGMVFLSVVKLSEHMACHITNGEQFPITVEEEREPCLVETGSKPQEQHIHQIVPKTSENCGKVSFNIADILSDSNTNKRCDNINLAGKVLEVGRLTESIENLRKEEPSVSENTLCNSPLPDDGGTLRTDFAHLLYIIVADGELMEQLGWGQRPIDLVLCDVLKHMGHSPVTSEQVGCDLDRLCQNIRIFLETCISDDIMTNVSGSKKTINTIVTEVLQMCRNQTNDVPALPSLITQINM